MRSVFPVWPKQLGLVLARGHVQALGNVVDGDDAVGAEHARTRHRELTHRTAAPNRHRVARRECAGLGCLIPGWKDVGQKQDLLVIERIRHAQRTDVCVRDPHVLGLAAGVSA